MSEAAGRWGTRRRLIERGLEDDAFRKGLLEEPVAAVEEELSTRLPERVRVVAVEETADTVYLVLPSAPPAGEGGELSDQDLETVAGGAGGPTSTAADCLLDTCGLNCEY